MTTPNYHFAGSRLPSVLSAADQRAAVDPAQPIVHLDGDFINADTPGVIRTLDLPESARKMPGFVRFEVDPIRP